MGERQTLEKKDRAIARVTGTVRERPRLEFDSLKKRDVAQCELNVDGQVLFIMALGDLAATLSKTPKDSRVAVDGHIQQEKWTTKDRTTHHRTVIVVDALEVLEAHEQCWMRRKP